MTTLQDLLDVRRLGLTLLAGDGGSGAWLRWVQVVEDELTALRGGELVLTTGRWRRSAADSDRFVAAITSRGAVGLAVAIHGSGGVPSDLIAACVRSGLPLLEIPGGISCESVSEVAMTLLVDHGGGALPETMTRQRALVDGAERTDSTPAALLDVLQRETGSRIWLFTRGGAFYPTNGAEPSSAELRAVGSAIAVRRPPAGVEIDGASLSLFAVADRLASSRPRAYLVVAAGGDDLPGDLRHAIDQTVLVLRQRFAAQHELRALRRRCEDELMRFIASDDSTRGGIDGWVRALGVEPRGHLVCLVVRGARGPNPRAYVRESLDDMADAVAMPRITVTGEDEVGIALFADHRAAAAERAIGRLRMLLSADPTTSMAVGGTSSVIATDVSDLTRAFLDARQVCRLNELREIEPANERVHELPLSAILLRGDADARRSLHAAVLAPLLDYDEEHGSELVRTLDVFLSSNGHWAGSAAELGVHVNTLRYRLTRIEEITDRKLGSIADRVDFYIALRARS